MTSSIERKYLHAMKQTEQIKNSLDGIFVPDPQSHPHGQLLWNFSELSYYCKLCKWRIIVGYYNVGYKTPRSNYTPKLVLAIEIHTDSKCRIDEPNLKDYLNRYRRRYD